MYECGNRCLHFNVNRPCIDILTLHTRAMDYHLTERPNRGLEPIALVTMTAKH